MAHLHLTRAAKRRPELLGESWSAPARHSTGRIDLLQGVAQQPQLCGQLFDRGDRLQCARANFT
jgi:hypothetical protein